MIRRTSHTTKVHRMRKKIVGLTPQDVVEAMRAAADKQPTHGTEPNTFPLWRRKKRGT
jgi:hypothetical protein